MPERRIHDYTTASKTSNFSYKRRIGKKILKTLRIKKEELLGYEIRKQSLDARKKPELFFVYTIDASVKKEEIVIKNKRKNRINYKSEKI